MMVPGASSTKFDVAVELGHFGCRVAASNRSVPILRLRRLVRHIHRFDTEELPELEWLLRHVDGADIEEQLEEFVRTASPREVVERLVLGRRTHVVIAYETLGIIDSLDERVKSDDQIISAILWKLGFDSIGRIDEWAEFWRLQRALEQAVQAFQQSTIMDAESLRGIAANYFVALEKVLTETLYFATWVLLFDHYGDERPFMFLPDRARPWAMRALNAAVVSGGSGFDPDSGIASHDESPDSEGAAIVYADDKVTLQQLVEGFNLLAQTCSALSGPDYERAADLRPRHAGKTPLREFRFEHTVPFLDLLPRAQRDLLDALKRTSRELSRSEVARARNDQSHYRRRSGSDTERLSGALRAVRDCLTDLQALGLLRTEYEFFRIQSDEWGRSEIVMVDATGREYTFAKPSPYEWNRVPTGGDPLYIVSGAKFAEPNEALRFRIGQGESYAEMWSNFPRRRKRELTVLPLPPRAEPKADMFAATNESRV